MDENEIIIEIIRLLNSDFNISSDKLIEANFDRPLTGNMFRLDGISLTYLFFALQKKIGFQIDTNKLKCYAFNSINGIAAFCYDNS